MEDLVAGIRLTQQVKLRFTADETLEPLLESNQKLTVYRILQEALNNVLRHSGAKEVSIKLSHRENIAQLVIADDGVGFQPENTKNGMGLKNIQNRIYLINGTLQVKSSAGNGCIIEIQFPINDRSKTKEHHGENNDPDSR
jgi:signal transduction histidine kinase